MGCALVGLLSLYKSREGGEQELDQPFLWSIFGRRYELSVGSVDGGNKRSKCGRRGYNGEGDDSSATSIVPSERFD
jgi:hypothetical protein